jgi:hypothetical protein
LPFSRIVILLPNKSVLRLRDSSIGCETRIGFGFKTAYLTDEIT